MFNKEIGKSKLLHFNEVGSGLYIFDKTGYVGKLKTSGYSFLTSAENIKGQFINEEISRAEKAITLRFPKLPGIF